MKKIKLTQGKFALVDDEDFDELNKFKWYAGSHYKENCLYALRRDNKIRKTILMHREIMQTPKGMVTDHIDHNGLNNQKINLRVCSHAQNIMNSAKSIEGTSKYKGVSVKDMGKNKYYRGRIFLNGKEVVKTFPYTPEGEIMAAQFYNEQAKIHYGQFANLNFGQ
jgi:HNH endonuclease